MTLIKRFLRLLLALPVLAVVALALFFWVRPVPISDARVLLNSLLGSTVAAPSEEVLGQRLQAPPGFSVSVYARNLKAPRFLRFTAAGDLLVSEPREGRIVLLERGRDGRAGASRVLLSGLDRPHGIDIADGWLYVGESTGVGRVRFDERQGRVAGDYRRIVTGLTGEGNHWTKTVRIGLDGYLYLAQGSTCNVCEEKDRRRATIMRFKADGSDGRIYATGLRNSVGMDWAPWDNALYATDNGRDLLGDDFPPDELNRIVEGGFYGWPYINGFGVLDPDLGKGRQALLQNAIAPAFGFRAHNAPLGIQFLRNPPPGYERTALVALHGSWNRSTPDGYKVVALHWRPDGSIEQRDFLTGFGKGYQGDIIGRPVDVAQGPDGAIYVSDDYSGVIYRVARGGPAPAAAATAPSEPLRDDKLAALDAQQRQRLSAQGRALFQRYRCGNCHDAAMAGGFRQVRTLDDLAGRYTVEKLQAFLATPTPPMPVFPLSDSEREAVAVYLLTR